jgi:hypothetical protein
MKITEEKVVVVKEKKELEVGDIVFTDSFISSGYMNTIPCCVVELADSLDEYGVIPLADPFTSNGSPNILRLHIEDVMWEYPILHIKIKDWRDLKFQNLN